MSARWAVGGGLVALSVLLLALVAGTPGSVAAQSSAVTIEPATVSPQTPTVGETFVVETTIRNAGSAGESFTITDAVVDTPGGRASVNSAPGTLAPGAAATIRIPVTIDEPGHHTLTLSVRGRDGPATDGVSNEAMRTLEQPVTVRVQDEGAARLSMAATADPVGPSNRTDLHVTIANGFERPVTAVDLRVDSDGLRLPEPQRVAPGLLPGNQTTFSLTARDVRPGEYDLDVWLEYTSPSGERNTVRRTLSTVVREMTAPGRVRLTGVEVTREGDELVVRGSAANEGAMPVSSVIVSVEDGETAGPADSTATYFVGGIPASDFSSFDVTAEPRANGTVTIPLEVSYRVDGVRTSRTIPVQHVLDDDGDGGDGEAAGGPSLVTVAALLVVVAGLVYGWRRYRG